MARVSTRNRAPEVETLDRALKRRTAPAAPELVRDLGDDKVQCLACGHRCRIPPGLDGICRVRSNVGGVLRVPRGYVAGLQVDPIEKKPFFHAFPGADALSFGMLGCDFHCGYCQNWLTSQALRDDAALAPPRDVSADELVGLAVRSRAPVVVSTYNEPLITTEWALDVFRGARRHGIVCGYVSNGNATPEVLELIRPVVDLYKVDLKSFRKDAYRELGGKVDNVLESIERLHGMGFWVEIVTLLVPGFNDSEGELRDIAGFLAGVSRDIPWHVTAFHADYRMAERRDTTVRDLLRAAAIGRAAGLRFVYAGNLPGRVGDLEDTHCPECGATVVARQGFRVTRFDLGPGGVCRRCETPIAGFWKADWSVPAGNDGPRVPRAVPLRPAPDL